MGYEFNFALVLQGGQIMTLAYYVMNVYATTASHRTDNTGC